MSGFLNVLTSVSSTGGSAPELKTGLGGWWDLSSDLVDQHGTDDMVDQGGGVVASGGYADFEGNSNEFLVGGSPITLTDGNPFSFSMWVWFDALTSTTFLYKRSGGTIPFIIDYNNAVANRFRASTYDAGITDDVVQSAGAASTGNWNHIVCVRDVSAGKWRMVINDGTPQEVNITKTLVTDSPVPIGMGAASNNVTRLDGRMRMVGVWNNRALDATRITWLYNSGSGRSYSELV